MAAPRSAPSHLAAPGRNMAAPHGGGPRFTGQAAPHRATPQVAGERGRPQGGRTASEGPRQRPGVGNAAREPGRNAASGPSPPLESRQQANQPEQSRRPDTIGSRPAPDRNAAERQQPPAAGAPSAAGSPGTVGRAPARPGEGRDGRFEQ